MNIPGAYSDTLYFSTNAHAYYSKIDINKKVPNVTSYRCNKKNSRWIFQKYFFISFIFSFSAIEEILWIIWRWWFEVYYIKKEI